MLKTKNIKISIFLFIFLLLLFSNQPSTYGNTSYTACYCINSIKDEKGNNLEYGKVFAYIDGCEVSSCSISLADPCYQLLIPYTLGDLGKEIIFYVKIEDKTIEAISDFKVLLDNNHQGGYYGTMINLTVSNLPPLLTGVKAYFGDKLISYGDTITVNIGDILKIKALAEYSDSSEKDITENCNWGLGDSAIDSFERIQYWEFKAVKADGKHNMFSIGYCGRELHFIINVIDTPPTLFNLSIWDNAIDIPINNIFTLQFNKPISEGNNYAGISILNSEGVPIGITKTINEGILTIKPIVNIKYYSNYILYIPAGSIKNLGTMSNTSDSIYHFTTEKEPNVILSELTSLVKSQINEHMDEYFVASVSGDTIILEIKEGSEKLNIENCFDILSILNIFIEVERVNPIQSITINSNTYLKSDLYSKNILNSLKTEFVSLVNDPQITNYSDILLENLVGKSFKSSFYKTDIILTFVLPQDKIDECFIATAAFGSKFQPSVVLLLHFRDQYLLSNSWGKAFVKFYYKNSPPIATFIAHSEPLKGMVRILLLPVIALAYSVMHPVVGVGVIGVILLLVLIKKYYPKTIF